MNIDDWTGTQISDEIIDQAAQWVASLDAQNNDATDVDVEPAVLFNVEPQLDFYTWLNQDPLHQMAFAQVSEIWARTAFLKHAEDLLEPSKILSFPSRLTHPVNRQQAFQCAKKPLIDSPLLQERHVEIAAPSWAYTVVIGVITLGFAMPFWGIPLL